MKSNRLIAPLAAMLLIVPLAAVAPAATVVWNGTPMIFNKPFAADYTLLENQDRITDQVWLTRKTREGLFNIKTEALFTHFVSPAGTAWANGTTANYATLSYTDWNTWAKVVNPGPPSTVGKDAVLHLLAEDIYLDIKFTSWDSVGGAFSYVRSTPVPEPGGFVLLGISTLLLAPCRRRRPSRTA